uniref:Suppressor APC domain-containing protein 2 n=1 Tax=Heterorhabditis bacteriophora TaxID=37862 RepID=A0A1I7WWK3_HETBA
MGLTFQAKLEGIHKEEADLVRRGLETTNKLSDWYKEKLTSLDKRSRLLNQRLVALDPAVHEQKLNFLRAHVTELNRRMVALMETSERGFPTHVNLQKNNLPQPQDDQLLWLYRQNEMLNQELGDKVRMLDDLRREKENGDRLAVTRIQPSRPVPIHHRPSAFVRPAFQSQPMHHVAASPIKTYDTLM